LMDLQGELVQHLGLAIALGDAVGAQRHLPRCARCLGLCCDCQGVVHVSCITFPTLTNRPASHSRTAMMMICTVAIAASEGSIPIRAYWIIATGRVMPPGS